MREGITQEVLEIINPGNPPCGCCDTFETDTNKEYWRCSCDCQNSGDLGEATAWCSAKNAYESVKKKLGEI